MYNCINMEERDLSVRDTQYVVVQHVFWYQCLKAVLVWSRMEASWGFAILERNY